MSQTVFCGYHSLFRRFRTPCALGCLVSFGRTPTTATKTTTANSSDAGEADENVKKFGFDPKRLPKTIPGVSQEELAARIEKYQQEMSYRASQASERTLINEIDTMRRSMPPDQFQQFLKDLDKMQAKNAKEAARLSAMSPQQLYRYQQRQRMRLRVRQILKTVWILVVFFGSIFFIFFPFYFFY